MFNLFCKKKPYTLPEVFAYEQQLPEDTRNLIESYLIYEKMIGQAYLSTFAYLRSDEMDFLEETGTRKRFQYKHEKLLRTVDPRKEVVRRAEVYRALTDLSHFIIFRGIPEPENAKENLAHLEADMNKAAEFLRDDGFDYARKTAKVWKREWQNFDRKDPKARILPLKTMALCQAAIKNLMHESSAILLDREILRRGNNLLADVIEYSIEGWKEPDDYDGDSKRMIALEQFGRFNHI